MFFKQFYLNCLAQASYLIADEKDAIVVDPQRDVDLYLDEAHRHGFKIKHIIETHLHADFVSGHMELAKRTGAMIHIGHRAKALFPHQARHENDEIRVGSTLLQFLETPGHTPESICVLIRDEANPELPFKLLTGDTLFIGDVGRPDLVGSKGFTSKQMAEMLYDSLFAKILQLPDSTEIFPGHGAGSACGKNISKETSSTLGQQKKTNYALLAATKEAFVQMVTSDLPPPPRYFPFDAELNRKGALPLQELPELKSLNVEDVVRLCNQGAWVIDLRSSSDFGKEHLPHSINLQLTGPFAPWSGTLLDHQLPLVLLGDHPNQLNEGRLRLARVGLENVAGYLEGGIPAWKKKGFETRRLSQLSVQDLHHRLYEQKEELQILDVRKPSEFSSGHVPTAKNFPLDDFLTSKSVAEFSSWVHSKPLVVICASGYRSSVAASILENEGFTNVLNVLGGTSAWFASQLPIEPTN